MIVHKWQMTHLFKNCKCGFVMAILAVAGSAMAANVDVLLVPGGCHGMFVPGETPELTLVVSNRTDCEVRFEAKLRTLDYFGNVVATGEETLAVCAKGAVEKRIAYPEIKRLGFYCTVADWKAGGVSGTVEGSFVKVGKPLAKPDKAFGVSCFCGNEVEVFKRMGVGTKGVQFNWGWLEDKKHPGLENMKLDNLKSDVKAMRKAGIRVFGMVSAMDTRIPGRYMKKVGKNDDPISDVPKYYADFEKFCKIIATAFKDDITDWSAGTEINLVAPQKPYAYERHIDLTRIFSRTVKSIIPGAAVLGISVSGGDGRIYPRFPFMRKLAPRLADCLDGLSPDQYTDGQGYGEGLANLNSEQTQFREIMQEVIAIADKNGMKRVAIDEKGPSFVRSLPIASPKGRFAADIVAREFIILKTLPRVDHWLYFRPFNWDPKSTHDWGMWEKHNPRQVVAAYAATARLMAHAEFVKGLDVHADVPCWTFRKDGRHFATLWYNGEKPLPFKLAGAPVEVCDAMGNAITGEITLSSSPVYVYFKSLAELENAILGAKYSIPSIDAIIETVASDRTVLVVRNKSGKPVSVKVAEFVATPTREMPEELKKTITVEAKATKTIELGFSAEKIALSLDSGEGAPISARSEFSPIRVGRIGGWDEIGKCMEVRLDDPLTQMPGYADLKVNGVYEGLDDLSVSARFGYGDDALYIEYQVKDDIHSNRSSPARVFHGDCVQFSFDAANNARTGVFGGKRGYDDDDYNFVAGSADGEPTLWCYVAGAETRERIQNKPLLQPEVSRDEVAKTTRYRVRIPFADLAPLKPEKGRVFGFTFLVFDYDPPATGHCQLRLSAGASTPFDPSLFKKFMFE